MHARPERRRHNRYLAGEMRLTSPTLSGSVLNVSRRGLGLQTSERVTLGRRYRFQLANDRVSVRLEGEVRWSRLVSTYRTLSGDVLPLFEVGMWLTGDVAARRPLERLLRGLRKVQA